MQLNTENEKIKNKKITVLLSTFGVDS